MYLHVGLCSFNLILMNLPTVDTIYLAVSLILVGVIWVIQLVHYPSFHFVDPQEFRGFHDHHTSSISFIVMPLMVLELALGAYLAFNDRIYLGPFIIVVLIWMSTFFIQVPLHNALASAKDEVNITQLVRTNWIRTLLWTVKGIWLVVLLRS